MRINDKMADIKTKVLKRKVMGDEIIELICYTNNGIKKPNNRITHFTVELKISYTTIILRWISPIQRFYAYEAFKQEVKKHQLEAYVRKSLKKLDED